MSHMAAQASRFSLLEQQGIYRMESFGDWHGEDWGQYKDDFDALQYYGTLGLYDPTIPGEVGVWKKSGAGLGKAIGFTFLRAVVPFATVMWIIDPADKREGGLAETQWYIRNVEPWYSVPGDVYDWLPFHNYD